MSNMNPDEIKTIEQPGEEQQTLKTAVEAEKAPIE